MITFPNAKINIGLHITGKRDDGYHDLATVFYPIGLADVLEVIEKKDNRDGKDITFINTGIGIDCNDDSNLVVKAYRKIQSGFSLPPVTAVLRKNIPFGAGLGGGSADASFMLMTHGSPTGSRLPVFHQKQMHVGHRARRRIRRNAVRFLAQRIPHCPD